MHGTVNNNPVCTLKRTFTWKPDQCPDCGYALCDHVAGTHGVNDAVFHCVRCAGRFAYGAILFRDGPAFIRTDASTKATSLMSFSRGWNRLVGRHRDHEFLLEAILSGQTVKTPWASYVLRGFHRGP
jgi:hypothetical protein